MVGMINELSPEELEKIPKEEFGEDTKAMQKDIKHLEDWIKKSPHLQNIRKDEVFLKVFLRGCKYSLERTKEKIDFHYTVRGTAREWFGNWDPLLPNIQKVMDAGIMTPLRGYDKHGRFAILSRIGNFDPATMSPDDMLKANLMMMETAMKGNMQAVLRGVVIIQDMSGATLSHATAFSIPLIKKIHTVFQEAYPTHPKAMHVLNLPPVMEKLHEMASSFQKKKMKDRQKIHPKGDFSGLHADVGIEVLPKEYGGTNDSIEDHVKYWRQEAENARDYLMLQSSYMTDESRRPGGKPKGYADIFGIEGSFRKLEID